MRNKLHKILASTSVVAILATIGFTIAGCETGYNSWTSREPEGRRVLTECRSSPDNCSDHRGGSHDANGNGHGTK